MIFRSWSPHPLTRAAAGLLLTLLAEARLCAQEPKSSPAPDTNAIRAMAAAPLSLGEQKLGSAELAGGTGSASAQNLKLATPRRDELDGLINLGLSLAERQDYEAAEIAYRQVIESERAGEAEIKRALLGYAHMFRRKGDLTKAAAIYERFLKDYPNDARVPDALLDLGRTYRGLGAYKMALSRFYALISSTLNLSGDGFERYQVLAKTAKFEIAETHFQAGEFAEANKYFTQFRLLDLAPEDRARAHFKAGYALRLQGDLEGAVSSLRAYIEQWPEDENLPEARYMLAVILREMKRPQDALNATLDLLRTEKSRMAADPKRWSYWQRRTGNQLANDFFEAGDTLNARAIYASLLELSEEPMWRLPITYQLGLCYERLGIIDRARFSYQTIVDAAGATPPENIAELARMAAWRIEHLEWRDRVNREISVFFETSSGKQAALPAPLNTAGTP